MRTRGIVLVLAVVAPLLATCLAAAQDVPALRLLACRAVAPDPLTQSVVQFERETFPPFAETGLFQTQGAELLFIEQGQFTVVSDRGGEELQQTGYSMLAAPESKLYARNDEASEASLLWLRLTSPLRRWSAVSGTALVSIQSEAAALDFQPLTIEFELPEIDGEAHLFIADLELAPGDAVPDVGDQLLESGRVAVVVEAGQVDITFENDSLSVPAGQWTAIDDGVRPFQLANAGTGFAEGYVAGLVAATDDAWINQEMIGGECPH